MYRIETYKKPNNHTSKETKVTNIFDCSNFLNTKSMNTIYITKQWLMKLQY